jgi:DNA-binding XRE family transcriptional regulator
MHPLKQYLQDIDETIQDFAQRVGASRQTLYRIIGGNQTPKPALARRIVEATGAAVAFEALYHGDPAQGEVVGLRAEYDAPLLEQDRLKVSLAIVINHLSPQDRQSPPDEAVEIAAEAVVNTYAALSPVTTRQGPDRLRQALRPVLEEILREFSGSPPPPSALDRGAELAAQLYFQPQRPGQHRKSLF